MGDKITFENFSGTAAEYIRTYLDPDDTFVNDPTTEDEARALWASLEKIHIADGGTGISEDDFVEARKWKSTNQSRR